MKSLLLLHICLVFATVANAQTIPKSIDKTVIPKTQKKVVAKQKPVYIENNKDSDADGLIDKIDECPDVKGMPKYNGCPEPVIKLPEMVYVSGGTFQMGSDDYWSKPIHTVTVSSFSISKFEISVAEYKIFCSLSGRVLADQSSRVLTADANKPANPIGGISFDDAVAYCQWLSSVTGKKYRLPTEAEWEFAAKGGIKTKGYIYSGSNNLDEVAWYKENSGGDHKAAGTKKPNELGIYDMSGNVSEWCSDWGGHYDIKPATNPQGGSSSIYKIRRGGTYVDSPGVLEVTHRSQERPETIYANYGFRVAVSEL